MPNPFRQKLLETLESRFGAIRRLEGSRSLFSIGSEAAVLYVRYSKLHDSKRTFFGLRETDLRRLEGRNSFICLLVDDDSLPVFIPYSDFEDIFKELGSGEGWTIQSSPSFRTRRA
jgi:hypothetical protein